MNKLLELGACIFLSYLVLTTGGPPYQGNVKNYATKTTIVNEFGEVFDCVDIYRQPAFDHPLMKNHVLQMKPSSYPKGFPFKYSSATNTTKAQLGRIPCPAGTIPVLRNNSVEHLPQDFSTILGGQLAIIATTDKIYGAHASFSIWKPEVKGYGDISATVMNVLNGRPGEGLEGIGAGSLVSSIFGDRFARFHVWREMQNKPCFDLQCKGFVQVGKFGLGQKITPVSVYKGIQVALTFLLFQDPKTKDWWLVVDDKPIGYWPSFLFTNLQERASMASFGGYVWGPTIKKQPPEMGSGHSAAEGELRAAYARNVKIVNIENLLTDLDRERTTCQASKPRCYSVDAFDYNSDGAHMFYGGPGGRCEY
ncbi:hypothetical protein ACQ4PT_046208 [Festuca glaucescens]